MVPPPVTDLVPVEQMTTDDEEDNELLADALEEATTYVQALEHCLEIRQRYLGLGIAGVVSVFLFHVEATPGSEPWQWVVSGDVPSAAFPLTSAPDPVGALEHYCETMAGWVERLRSGEEVGAEPPPNLAYRAEHSVALAERIAFLRQEIIPTFRRS